MAINIYSAWIVFLLGCVAGAIPGLFFNREDWLGGYASWSRRMIRLAHISFFGIGLINLAFGLTARMMEIHSGLTTPSVLLIAAALTMPLVCYLSAWKVFLRHLFCVPALCLAAGISLFLWRLLSS